MANIKFSALADGSPLDLTDRLVGIPTSGAAQIFDVRTVHIVKKVDEVIQSDTTLSDDTELFFTPTINKNYNINLYLYFASEGNADMTIAVTIPTGAQAEVLNQTWDAVNARFTRDWTTSDDIGGGGSAQIRTTEMHGRLIMGGTAGDFNFQWAQQVSQATDTTVFAGSALIVWEE